MSAHKGDVIALLRHRWTVTLVAAVLAVPAVAQNQPGGQNNQSMVRLTLQGDVKLDALVKYLSDRLGIQFQYSGDLANRTVTVHTPAAVPVSALPVLLGSVLKSENLAIVDSELPGWKRIVDVAAMKQFAPVGQAEEVQRRDGPAAPVTQVFMLRNASAKDLTNILQPFMTKAGSNLFTVPNTNVLVATDYASTIEKLAELIRLVDTPVGESVVEFYEVKHQQSAILVEKVQSILGDPPSGTSQPVANVNVFDEPVGNRIVIVGDQTLAGHARELLEQLDISVGMQTQVYRLQHLTAERLDKLISGHLAPKDVQSAYQSTIDEDGNILVVRATRQIHEDIERLLERLDQPAQADESPIQFYKLKNARALDVLYSLLALQEAYGGAVPGGVAGGAVQTGVLGSGALGGGAISTLPAINNATAAFPNLQRNNSMLGGQPAPVTPTIPTTPLPLAPAGTVGNPGSFVPNMDHPLSGQAYGVGGAAYGGGAGVASLPGGARVSADIGTNSLIVFAPANVQPIYKQLIESLDQRRPQVLIEAKIVAIDTTDDFSLGVEVSFGDRQGTEKLFRFTSFGLSEVNSNTGQLAIIPGLGFNGALVDPDVADVVVRALSSHSRARVLAAPKILVNDNSVGKLESVVSVPFSSVNASQTVSTTSLGGDQQAGTIITVTPHIHEDDHLQLEFDVEFSTFSGAGTPELPPPRQIDRVGSTVTIPDGKTVIVGGLKRIGTTDTYSGIPWVEYVPLLRDLTGRSDDSLTTTSFFLFIRPMVLRDSRFADLRFLSDMEAGEAQLPGDFPVSEPELVR